MPKTKRQRTTEANDIISVHFLPMYLTSTINILMNDPSIGDSDDFKGFSNGFMLDASLKMLIA